MTYKKKPATKETTKEIEKTTPKIEENIQNPSNSIEKPINQISSQTSPTKELTYIKNKRAYAVFKRYVAKGKYTSAHAAALACGVDPSTIRTWLKTKTIIDTMSSEVGSYIDKIAASPDWKATQYLLERVSPTIKEDHSVNTAIQIVLPTLQDTQGQILAL